MFIVPLPLKLALQRSAMCFQSIELNVAPDGATSLGFILGGKTRGRGDLQDSPRLRVSPSPRLRVSASRFCTWL